MKRYLCLACGTIRRGPTVHEEQQLLTPNDKAVRIPRWPRHCQRPMHRLTDEQYAAARGLQKHLRVPWATSGLHVLIERPDRGRCRYRAAVWPRDVREVLRRAAEEERQRIEAEVAAEQQRRAQIELLARAMADQKPAPPVDQVEQWLTWNNETVRTLAGIIRQDWDNGLFPILADALEDAECSDADLVRICRHGGVGAEVARRWVLLVLLGRMATVSPITEPWPGTASAQAPSLSRSSSTSFCNLLTWSSSDSTGFWTRGVVGLG